MEVALLSFCVQRKEAPGDEIPSPLAVRVTGGIRNRNLPIRQKGALSVELQPHAGAT
jgi:hypothetical protein